MSHPIHLIYLDDYHLDDPLFVPSMGRMMARLRRTLPACLIVHDCGEQAERLLEAEGLFPERRDGRIQTRTRQEVALVEHAARLVNRRIVSTLTDEGVHAIGLHGTDRGLLRLGDDGKVTPGRTNWLRDLVLKRVVPVFSTLVHDPMAENPRAEMLPTVTMALAGALAAEGIVVVFFTPNNQPGLFEGETHRDRLTLEALPEGVLPEAEAVRKAAAAGFPVLLTSTAGLFGGKTPHGTRILL